MIITKKLVMAQKRTSHTARLFGLHFPMRLETVVYGLTENCPMVASLCHQDRTNASMSAVKTAMTEKCRRTSWVSQSVSMHTAIYHSAPRVSSPTPVLSTTIG